MSSGNQLAILSPQKGALSLMRATGTFCSERCIWSPSAFSSADTPLAHPRVSFDSCYMALLSQGRAWSWSMRTRRFSFCISAGALFLLLKLAMLCVIPFAWSYRLPILIAVIVIGSVGSHMPKKFRHYSLIYGPEQKK